MTLLTITNMGMSKDDFEDMIISLCEQYMEDHDLADCCFDIGINIYGSTVNPCISIYNEVKSN